MQVHRSSKANIGIWMKLPLPEKDQVVPHTSELEDDYDLTMQLPPTPISAEEEPDKEEMTKI